MQELDRHHQIQWLKSTKPQVRSNPEKENGKRTEEMGNHVDSAYLTCKQTHTRSSRTPHAWEPCAFDWGRRRNSPQIGELRVFENQSLQNHKIRQLMCDIPTDMLWSVDCGSLMSTLRRPNRLWTHLVKAHKASEPLSSQSVATNKLDSSFPVYLHCLDSSFQVYVV